MGFDTTAARRNITARLADIGLTIPDYTNFRGIPDDALVPKYSSGRIKPYGAVKFAGPIPTAKGRGLALDESQQPHILAVMFIGYGGTQEEAEDVSIAGANLLVGFLPDGGNATALKASGGYSFPSSATGNQPSRYKEAVTFQCVMGQDVTG